ncbi:MAG: substrate-binding domain-containing protein [Hyphomicrobiaceae bacterium]
MNQAQVNTGKKWVAASAMVGLAALALVATPTSAHHPSVVKIGGTGGALGGLQLLAKSFMKSNPETRIVVLPSLGSGGGIKALAVGKIDLALSARKLKKTEQAKGIVATAYAKTPLIFATRHDSAISSVSQEDLAGIYAGKKSSWSDGSRLRLVMRPAKESDNKLLYNLSTEIKTAALSATKRSDLYVARTDQDNANAIERVRGSLGITTLGQITAEGRDIKPLAFNGVDGTIENLEKGAYPHSKTFYIVSKPEHTRAVAEFLQFVASPQGRSILSSSNHVVVDTSG